MQFPQRQSIEEPPRAAAVVEIKPEKNTKCGVCETEMFSIDSTPIHPCGHCFHPSCITQFLSEHRNRKSILCPMSICKTAIQESCVTELVGKITKSCCPRPGCDYTFEVVKGGIKGKSGGSTITTKEFVCPKCKKSYCLKCRCVFHTGKTCEDYCKANPLAAEVSDEGGNFKECPKCKYWLEKILVHFVYTRRDNL